MTLDNTDFKIKQFEKFYYFLMKEAPEGYTPWFFPCEKNGKNPSPQAIFKLAPNKSLCCNAEWVYRITREEEKSETKSKPQWRCDVCEKTKGSWHGLHAKLTKEQVIQHIRQGFNIGLSARNEDKLIIGDIDEKEFLEQAPKDTLTSTSRKRAGIHFFGWDKDGTAKINLPTDAGEMRSQNQYVLAPGSYVPFNLEKKKDKKAFDELPKEAREDKLLGYYTIKDSIAPREISFNELPIFFQEKESENLEAEAKIKNREFENKRGKYGELFNLKVSDIVGLIPPNKRQGHPLHESDTDANFSLSKDGSIAHCWRHLVSLNAVQYLCVKAGYKSCADCGTPHKGRGISKIKGDKKALRVAYDEAVKLGLIKKREISPEPLNKETKKINLKLEAIAKLTDPLDIEDELKKIKKDTGFSIKILREKVREIKKEFAKEIKEYSDLPCNIDPRFEQEDLLIHISKELNKDHIDDDREKLGTFIVGASSELPNPKDHVSVAHKGDSAAGKTNVQISVIKHFPGEENGIATRITQSEMEDRIQDWKRLVITEINKHREGANTEITETFKQVMEDGIRIYKKDNITGESKEINVPQKSGFYATTETETDDELETRYIVISVRGSENKNRAVVDDTLSKVSDIDSILNKLDEKESWIAESIRGLNSELDVVIPFAKEMNRKFQTEEGEKELFDYSKERVKRDVKRLMSLTKAIAWLFQKRRIIIDNKIIVAEPTDFLTALKIFIPFFNVSYSGLDSRIEDTLNKIKNLEGKHSEEIEKEFGDLDVRRGWVMRHYLKKELGISVNTVVKYIKKLRNEGLIDTYWSESHPKFYLIRPIKVPISRLLDPITLQAMTGHLQAYCYAKNEENIYKKYKKEKLDTIPLVNNIEFDAPTPILTGVKLTGINPEVYANAKKINFKDLEL